MELFEMHVCIRTVQRYLTEITSRIRKYL